MVPQPVQDPTTQLADDFTAQLAVSLDIQRDEAETRLGELLWRYHALARRRVAESTNQPAKRETPTRPPELEHAR